LFVKIAPYTFGVYLIHDNYYIRNYLWSKFDWNSSLNSEFFLAYMLATTITIFCVCVLIDYGRNLLFRVLRIAELQDVVCKKMEKYIPFE